MTIFYRFIWRIMSIISIIIFTITLPFIYWNKYFDIVAYLLIYIVFDSYNYLKKHKLMKTHIKFIIAWSIMAVAFILTF